MDGHQDKCAATSIMPIELQAAKAFLLRGPEGCVLIDTGIPPMLPKLKQRLHELVSDFSEIKLIVITHGHTDHTGGAKALRELIGAPIAMHKADIGLVDGTSRERFRPRTPVGWLALPFTSMMQLPATSRFTPDIHITDTGFDMRSYGVEADVVHTPGHTAGSLSILIGDVVMVADLVMPSSFAPSKPGPPMFAEDLDLVRQSVKQVLATNPRQIVCAHGGPYEPAAVAKAFGV